MKSDPPVLDAEPEESLGPIEPPYPSPSFKRNYTALLTQFKESWNDWADPFSLYPQLPFDPVLPSGMLNTTVLFMSLSNSCL